MLGKDEVLPHTEPLHPLIYDALQRAINDYYTRIEPCFSNPYKRMRAGTISNLANEFLSDSCANDPRFHTEFKYERVLVYVGDTGICLRLKKLTPSPELRSRNIPTQQSLQFEQQQGEQMYFPFCAPPTNLTAGYVLDELTGEFDVYLTCPGANGNAWDYQIEGRVALSIVQAPTMRKKSEEGWKRRDEDRDADVGKKQSGGNKE
jgi:hypothetical protein